MAAAYLKGKGYENFAFVDDTVKETYWSVDRERAFRRALPKKCCYARYGGASAREREDWMLERPHLARWLRSLKKPCGVFAPNDRRGKQVLDAAYAEGLNVPGEIGVLSCDNDTWICDASIPTMSSIRCDTKSAGYKIASILDDMLHGKKFPRRTEVVVEPIEVVERQSTNWYAVKDDKVAQMLKLIHESFADRDLDVTHLARVSGLARRTLEIRFKNSTGHTLRKEIEFVRISKAKSLLLENRLSVSEIAKATGYASPAQFCLRFKLATGKTPRAFASSMTATEAT
jgi:LacI family transcriptional regulator